MDGRALNDDSFKAVDPICFGARDEFDLCLGELVENREIGSLPFKSG
jgi:hypothetical protein